MLTRALEFNQEDQIYFQHLGYQTLTIPLTAIHYRQFSAVTRCQLQVSEWLFFTSQTPVDLVLPLLATTCKIAVIGEKTAACVRSYGIEPTFISPFPNKKAMIAAFKKQYPQPTTIFYPKSQLADCFVENQLEVTHQVTAVIAYENRYPPASSALLAEALSQNLLTAAYFASPSAWHRFARVYQSNPQPLTFFAIGATTQAAIQAAGYSATIIH
ncbi:uroporphyrinogen-III synthase [Enterococcus faecalis]